MVSPIEVVFFYYKMMDSQGQLIDSNNGKPIGIIQGRNQIFEPIEKALMAMEPGEKRKIAVPSKFAYGEHDPNLVARVPISEFKKNKKIGESVSMPVSGGFFRDMKIVAAKGGFYILDANHLLAGADFVFSIEVTRRRLAFTGEIESGAIQKKDFPKYALRSRGNMS